MKTTLLALGVTLAVVAWLAYIVVGRVNESICVSLLAMASLLGRITLQLDEAKK